MTPEPRTFSITQPFMKGSDIENWQNELRRQFTRMNIDYPVRQDGVYGLATRSATTSLCHALGMNAGEVMAEGVTPHLRIRIRSRKLTVAEQRRFRIDRIPYRRALRKRYNVSRKVSLPVAKIIEASWGYHPPGHDGLDVICPPHATLHAMVRSEVVRADNGGWWGKAPSGDVTKGDGIVILKILENIGPFAKGDFIGYGHAESVKVSAGDIVEAGEPIASAGLAVAWHIHLMWNRGPFLGIKGRGDSDPMKLIDYARKHA